MSWGCVIEESERIGMLFCDSLLFYHDGERTQNISQLFPHCFSKLTSKYDNNFIMEKTQHFLHIRFVFRQSLKQDILHCTLPSQLESLYV